MTHCLKTINPFFQDVWDRKKGFEVRHNDREFQENDTVWLQEYDPETKTYSGREVGGVITYVLRDYHAVHEDYVVFGFQETGRQL